MNPKVIAKILMAGVLVLFSTSCVPGLAAISPTETATATNKPTTTATETPTSTPTETLTPTATEKPTAEDRWQLSPDGHVYYNEAKLYGGLFTIDADHPEYAQKYWEDTIRGLWNLNSIGKNTTFLAKFPTDESLVKYLQDGGSPVRNLWIPVIYPNGERRYWYLATLIPTDGPVDLSHIAVIIMKPRIDEIMKYSPKYGLTEFLPYY